MEVGTVVVAVAAFMRAAAAAETVSRGAARVLSPLWGQALVLLVGQWWAVASGRGAAGSISRRRNRFGLDVQALSRGQGEI